MIVRPSPSAFILLCAATSLAPAGGFSSFRGAGFGSRVAALPNLQP